MSKTPFENRRNSKILKKDNIKEDEFYVNKDFNISNVKMAWDLFEQIDFKRDNFIDMDELEEFLIKNFKFHPTKETMMRLIAEMDSTFT